MKLLGMEEAIHAFPDYLEEAQKLSVRFTFPIMKGENAVILGMGGSAIGGEIAQSLADLHSGIPVRVIRDETIPSSVNEKTIVLVVSYSGNTLETLAAFKAALRKTRQIVVMATGGKLKEEALKEKLTCLEIPGGLMPRAALPYLLVPILTALEKFTLLPQQAGALSESIRLLKEMRESFARQRENDAAKLARALRGKLPIIYASTPFLSPAATRWKCQMNENAKEPAYAAILPEAAHNEVVGFTVPLPIHKEMAAVVLRAPNESPVTAKRVEFLKKLVKQAGGGAHEITARGQSPLAQLLYLCYLGDFASLYLAIENGLDPDPIQVIDALKEELK